MRPWTEWHQHAIPLQIIRDMNAQQLKCVNMFHGYSIHSDRQWRVFENWANQMSIMTSKHTVWALGLMVEPPSWI